jgi:signal transduction histidine kinase
MDYTPNPQSGSYLKKAVIKIFLIEWVRKLSVQNKFFIIIGLMVALLVLGLGQLSFGMKVVSSIRAYVGGEGLWSKTQKEAVNSLIAYSVSFNESDYQSFVALLQVPLGDKQARLELEKKLPNIDIAHQGFIFGGNNAADVDDMIFLYRQFRHVSYMSNAIDIWTEGDAGISELMQVGENMHAVISASSDPAQQEMRSLQIMPLVARVYQIDQKLTLLENRFSATLGEGSRSIRRVLFWVAFVLTCIFGAAVLFVILLIKKMLIQVDVAKTEFVSLASHQLKTPLTTIGWYAEMLAAGRGGELTSKARAYVEKIFHNNQRMVALVNSLLNVSRIEMGTLIIFPEPISIVKIADNVLEELFLAIEIKALKINKLYDKNTPLIFADPQLVRIVLQNLLSNAVKYTQKNGKIFVVIKKQAENIHITISDTGCGIPAYQQQQIFTKLFRADNAKAIETNGSGLGLYIVKAIIDQTGGKIWFESAENKGTNFNITLPIKGMKKKAGSVNLVGL